MRVSEGFLNDFVKRFTTEPNDAWMFKHMLLTKGSTTSTADDPALLLQVLRNDLDNIFVPCEDSIRIGKWIYSTARGFIAHRYQSPLDYVDICMSPADRISLSKVPSLKNFTADSVPVFAVDGLPGSGKSALFRALKRIFPKPQVIAAEGNPPQKIGTVSALWLSVNSSFSLKSWMQETLHDLGTNLGKGKGYGTVNAMTLPMFKALHRTGVAAILVDELQFASGVTSARRVLSQLLEMREFGLPIFFFANTDLLLTIAKSPAQIAQRIPRDKKTLMPLLRTNDAFIKILTAQLNLVPFGHSIDIAKEGLNIYDMTAGLPRASARLIEIAAAETLRKRKPLALIDLIEAKRSPSFDSIRKHISVITALAPVDIKKYPELSSYTNQVNPTDAYLRQMREERIQDAAALGLYASYTESEREATRAVETQVLRDSAKIPKNVQAIGEAKRKRKPKAESEDILKKSYAASKLAHFPPKNPSDPS